MNLLRKVVVFILIIKFVKSEDVVTLNTDNENELLNEQEVVNYLLSNNYLIVNSTDLVTLEIGDENVKDALLSFQEFYGIQDDGELNSETLRLMSRPRCGFADRLPNPFMLGPAKWNKTSISWNFINAQSYEFALTDKAFLTWQNHSSYKFHYEPRTRRADILISYKKLEHYFSRCCNRSKCDSHFDGKGQILAHAYYPLAYYKPVEIHIDEDENWNYADELGNFYQTLLHEIGHSLGLGHSSINGSVMYPFAQTRNTSDLSEDDIFAIQSRYKYPRKTTTISTTTTQKLTTKTTTTQQPSIQSDENMLKSEDANICEYHKELKTFLFANGKFYIFHKNLVWMKDVKDIVLHKPDSLFNWLSFLSKNSKKFFEIQSIYHQSESEIVLIIDDMVYTIKIPSLQLLHTPTHINSYYSGLPDQIQIKSVFNSYFNHIYVLYNDIHLGKLDFCYKKFEYVGLFSDIFVGVPSTIDGVYRYNDGNIYFIANDFIYVYNEFLRTIKEVLPRNAKSFGLECPNKPLHKQLQDLLSQILFKKIKI